MLTERCLHGGWPPQAACLPTRAFCTTDSTQQHLLLVQGGLIILAVLALLPVLSLTSALPLWLLLRQLPLAAILYSTFQAQQCVH